MPGTPPVAPLTKFLAQLGADVVTDPTYTHLTILRPVMVFPDDADLRLAFQHTLEGTLLVRYAEIMRDGKVNAVSARLLHEAWPMKYFAAEVEKRRKGGMAAGAVLLAAVDHVETRDTPVFLKRIYEDVASFFKPSWGSKAGSIEREGWSTFKAMSAFWAVRVKMDDIDDEQGAFPCDADKLPHFLSLVVEFQRRAIAAGILKQSDFAQLPDEVLALLPKLVPNPEEEGRRPQNVDPLYSWLLFLSARIRLIRLLRYFFPRHQNDDEHLPR